MLFNSAEFLFVFLPAAVAGFEVAGRFFGGRAAVAWLTVLSFVFYATWNPVFLFLIGSSILFNYGFAYLIDRRRGRMQSIVVSAAVAGDVLLLFYYKYLPPIAAFMRGAGLTGMNLDSVILPLGISFFTFTQIGYLLDLKAGRARFESFLYYCFFVTFFPHLIAGPILHHSEIIPALRERKKFMLSSPDLAAGITLFSIGFAKKTFIADRFAGYVTWAFANPAAAGLSGAWIAALSYTIQLYFDFSGYSDMAIGLAWMFSIRFPVNFNSPYKSKSVIEFWQRWHITLTRYLTMYVYNPIAVWVARKYADKGHVVRRGSARSFIGFTTLIAFPTMSTMLLSGIWHGAAIHVVLFGVLHGVYLTMNQAWRVFRPHSGSKGAPGPASIAGSITSTALVFVAVVISFVFFRAPSVTAAVQLTGGMLGMHGLWNSGMHGIEFHGMTKCAEIALALVVCWVAPNSNEILARSGLFLKEKFSVPRVLAWQPNVAWAVISILIFLTGLFNMANSTEFLYFQF